MKASCKQLKAALVLGVRKLRPASVMLKLGEFLLFDYFLDLSNFWDLDVFWPFDFPNFLAYSTPSLPNLLTLSLLSFFPETGMLLSFLLKADLLLSFLLGAGSLVVFNIEISGAAILLKSWINYQ